MNGVEILNQVTKYREENSGMVTYIGLIAIAFLIVAAIFELLKNRKLSYWAGGIGVLIFLCGLLVPKQKFPYQVYQVTISDEVKFVDFTSRYDIISQEGKIYTIKEKER